MTTASRVTRILSDSGRTRLFRARYTLEVVRGPDKGKALTTAKERITIGSAEKNDLVLTDAAVSRHHVRIELSPAGLVLCDLGSTNGTSINNLKVREVVVEGPVELRIGDDTIRLTPLAEEEEIPLDDEDRFGAVLGKSAPMRDLFRKLKSASAQDVTLLLEGETGTGKELIAREIHAHSQRKNGPFIIVDCGAIPATLIESELFGHTRGAFTGAVEDRAGAFEEAHGGTIFLDEIGELDLAMQPRLLRVLEARQIKRVGTSLHKDVDVRVIAATTRDLLRASNDGTFRTDLYYRLAVVSLRVPALRDRVDDIAALIEEMLTRIAEKMKLAELPKLSSETMQQLVRHPWPGNVRELRNFLERLVALSEGTFFLDLPEELAVRAPKRELAIEDLENEPFREAKLRWTEYFDQAYLSRLLERCKANVAEAARQSGIDRVHLFRLIKKYKLR